jgi:hypothetical protein
LLGLGVGGEGRREELERNDAFEQGVFGFVDDAHPAFAELSEDFVVRNGLPDHGWFLLYLPIIHDPWIVDNATKLRQSSRNKPLKA